MNIPEEYRGLIGKKALVLDSYKTGIPIVSFLAEMAGMSATFIPETDFPLAEDGLLNLAKQCFPHVFLLHIPGTDFNDIANLRILQVGRTKNFPLIVMEGAWVNDATGKIYNNIRESGISVYDRNLGAVNMMGLIKKILLGE